MKAIARVLGRIAMIMLAAALIIGISTVAARSVHPRANPLRVNQDIFNQSRERRGPRRRAPESNPAALPIFLRQGAFYALFAIVGRKAFRLRL
jgi:hypothetical protein